MADTANRATTATWTFHNASKYVAVRDEAGEERFMMGTPPDVQNAIWEEDWTIEPFPFKVYETLDPLELPRELPPLTMPALEALAATGEEIFGDAIPDLAALARICLLSNGILKRGSHRPGGQEILYRAAGGTGARYHLELYLVCGDVPELSAGVYHYSAEDHSLRKLREGDHRAVLVEATGGEPAIASAPAVLAMTSTFWRNAWRYKARAYRHTFWDAGTTFANILPLAAASGLPTRVVLGYADNEVNALLDVDGEREAVVALCAVGRAAGRGLRAAGGESHAARGPRPAALNLPYRQPSSREVVFPEIGPMHAASVLASGEAAAAWRAEPLRRVLPEPTGKLVPLRPLADDQLPAEPIDAVIRKRRSTRHYASDTPISFEAFSTLLDRSTRGFAADCLALGVPPLHDEYLIVNNVEGLEQGAYVLHPDRQAIELLKAGDFRESARRLAVIQDYAAETHVNIYYLTDLHPVLERYGNRGYRLAQLECALYAGRLHLGTHALGLGAVGSTSFDDEVVEFFSPHAAGKSYMFINVFGLRRRRAEG